MTLPCSWARRRSQLADTRWYHDFSSCYHPNDIVLGIWLVYSRNSWGHSNIRAILGLWHRNYTLWLYKARKQECLTKPGKPSSAG